MGDDSYYFLIVIVDSTRKCVRKLTDQTIRQRKEAPPDGPAQTTSRHDRVETTTPRSHGGANDINFTKVGDFLLIERYFSCELSCTSSKVKEQLFIIANKRAFFNTIFT